jgi:hypothetical protein
VTLLEILIFVPLGIVCWTVATTLLFLLLGILTSPHEEKKK